MPGFCLSNVQVLPIFVLTLSSALIRKAHIPDNMQISHYRFPLALLLCSILFIQGCKKSTEEKKPDYACDCSKYGKNLASFVLDKPLTLIPYYDTDKKWGFLDPSGSVIIAPKYHEALRFSGDRALIVDNTYGKEYVGFLNPEGELAIEPKYHFIGMYFSKEGLLPVGDAKTWKVGFLDRDGRMAIPYQYSYAYSFHNGMATVSNGAFEGATDIHGNTVIPMVYNSVGAFSEGLAFVITPSGRHGYIDSSNNFVIEGTFTEGGWFVDGLAWVNDPISHLYGYIRKDGSYLVQPKYQAAGNFWEGFAAVKQGGKWGFIDETGATRIPFQFDDIAGGFSEGLAAVEKNGKWGYLGADGHYVIEGQFDDADVFCCGVAMVSFTDATYGFINRQGNLVWQSKTAILKQGEAKPEKLADSECRPGIGAVSEK
jgi:hypothetical protein